MLNHPTSMHLMSKSLDIIFMEVDVQSQKFSVYPHSDVSCVRGIRLFWSFGTRQLQILMDS